MAAKSTATSLVFDYAVASTDTDVTSLAIKTVNLNVKGLPPAIHFFITAGDNFKVLNFIATDQGATISGSATKQ